MTENREQLERLMSERLDGTLTLADLDELRRATAGDAQLASAARRYARLQVLLVGWRALQPGIDWQAFSRQVADRIAVDAAREDTDATAGAAVTASAGVDDLLQAWAKPLPEVDWDGFRNRVSAAVRREAANLGREALLSETAALWSTPAKRRWSRAARWAASIGAPLAAAAAIAAMVWWPRGGPLVPPKLGPAEALVMVSLEVPEALGHVTIHFDEAPAGETPAERPASGGVAFLAGASDADGHEALYDEYFY